MCTKISSPLAFGSREVPSVSSTKHAALQSAAGAPLPEAGYEALRRVSRAIAAHRDVKNLFHSLADELRPVVKFVFLRVFLYDENTRLMRLHVKRSARAVYGGVQ